jgi:hypothetical protein
MQQFLHFNLETARLEKDGKLPNMPSRLIVKTKNDKGFPYWSQLKTVQYYLE